MRSRFEPNALLDDHLKKAHILTSSLLSFAEIIPQSLCTRYGLYFGAKMAGLVRVLMWTLVSLIP